MAGLRALLGFAAASAASLLIAPTGAAAAPTPIPRPGGLTPKQLSATSAAFGDCALAGVTCKPARSGSCQNYSSQTTPPATIKVLVRTSSTTVAISAVPFKTYVENVLPNEWIPSWDGDALKAGAVAVKSYAWYWVTHFGGYLNGDPAQCFDVTDDTNFQVYKANSTQSRTNAAVEESWPVVARMNGQVMQASYLAYLNSTGEACGAYATGSTLSQYGTQNCVEENTGNKYNVILQAYYFPGLQLATTRQRRTPHDFTFEQTSTRAIWTSGYWQLDDGYGTGRSFGVRGDRPVITDNGDGFAHIGVWRPSTGQWYLGAPTGAIASTLKWGWNGDIPVPGHYAGSTAASVPTIWRPSTGRWYVYGRTSVQWGAKGDIPVPGDYTGDGTTDFATFRPSTGTWWVRGQVSVKYGQKGDVPVPADYTGDGKTDIAVYRPSNHTWYVRGMTPVVWGVNGDVPVTGDYTGDGKADITMYRPSNGRWYVPGQASVPFGRAGAVPIGAAPYSQ